MLYLVPFAAFLVGLLAGYAPLRAGRMDLCLGFGTMMSALGLWALWAEGTTVGMDALIYTLLVWGVVAPGLLAGALGAILGQWDRSALPAT